MAGNISPREVLEHLSNLQVEEILQSTTFWACCLALLATLYFVGSGAKKTSIYPTINEKSSSWFNRDGKVNYTKNARNLLIDGSRKVLISSLRLAFLPC